MRTVYIIRDQEEDEAVLDELEARGLAQSEFAVENPVCPACGSDLLLAIVEGKNYWLVTDDIDDEDAERAHGWRLTCLNLMCDWEEPVQRVFSPEGATLFDCEQSAGAYRGAFPIEELLPVGLRELMAELRRMDPGCPSRKLSAILEHARWEYETDMQSRREWLARVPVGRRIEFYLGGKGRTATFLAATENGFLCESRPDGAMMVVDAEYIGGYGPQHFVDPDEEERPFDGRNLVPVDMCRDMVVIRGHHLHMRWEGRLGMCSVGTWDATVGEALGLERKGENYWEGSFRRSQIESRYWSKKMVRVSGHWLEQAGTQESTGRIAVQTENAEAAAALGLEPMRSWDEGHLPEAERRIIHWYGLIPKAMVEERREDRLSIWPVTDEELRPWFGKGKA